MLDQTNPFMAKRLGMLSLLIGLSLNLGWAQSTSNFDLFEEICDSVANHLVRQDFIQNELPILREQYRQRISSSMSDIAFADLVNEMLGKANISHTQYYVKSDPKYYQLASIFEGLPRIQDLFLGDSIRYPSIGIVTEEIDYTTFIKGIMEGSIAEEAGLKVGDEIVHANGRPYNGISSLQSEKTLLMIRREADSPRELITVYPRVVNPSLEYLQTLKNSARIIEKDGVKVGYVHIWSYAAEFYHEAFLDLIIYDTLAQADVLVWDLRNGWGGASLDYLNTFNKSIPKMALVDKNGVSYNFDQQWRKPVVMLTDETVRSGKELLAYSFKKHKIGPIVGATTAGAISAGTPFVLSDGSLLYVAVREVVIDGYVLEGRGVKPDIEVYFEKPYANGSDPQLDRAVEEAIKLVKK